MFSDEKHDPTGRFAGLARTYASYRPSYPDAAIDRIVGRIADASRPIVDVGAGTGILARQLAARGFRVIGIEPNESMRSEALAFANEPPIDFRMGKAEQTGLADQSASAVIAGQTFHWCEPIASLIEFYRILAPGGRATLLWNTYDTDEAATAEYWQLLCRYTPEPSVTARPHHESGEVLLTSPLFAGAEKVSVPHEQLLDEEGLIGRAFSVSYAPKECGPSQRFADGLRDLFHRRAEGGRFRLTYRTVLFQAQRTAN